MGTGRCGSRNEDQRNSHKTVSIELIYLFNFRFPKTCSPFLTASPYEKYSFYIRSVKIQTHGGKKTNKQKNLTSLSTLRALQKFRPTSAFLSPGHQEGACLCDRTRPSPLLNSFSVSLPHSMRWLLDILLVQLDANQSQNKILFLGEGVESLNLPLSFPHPCFNLTNLPTRFGQPGIRKHPGEGARSRSRETRVTTQEAK